MESGMYVLLVIWSLFIMYIIFWKLKMLHFESQMQDVLRKANEDYFNTARDRILQIAKEEIGKKLANTLVEARVVGRDITFRFTESDQNDTKV